MRPVTQDDIERRAVARMTGAALPEGVLVRKFFADGKGCRLNIGQGAGLAHTRTQLAERSDVYATVEPGHDGVGIRFGGPMKIQFELYVAELELLDEAAKEIGHDLADIEQRRQQAQRNIDELLSGRPAPVAAPTKPYVCDCGCTCRVCAEGHNTGKQPHTEACSERVHSASASY